jgi:hypothetical protein
LPLPQISHVPATVKSSITCKLLKAGIRYHKTVNHAREKCWNVGGRLTFRWF